MFLRKKLSDTQNSCVQLEGWLNELSDFLNELMYVDDDGNHSSVRGIKQTVDKSRHMIQSMSSTLLGNNFNHHVIKFYHSIFLIFYTFLEKHNFVCLVVFNATFNNISVILCRSVLLVQETGGPLTCCKSLTIFIT